MNIKTPTGYEGDRVGDKTVFASLEEQHIHAHILFVLPEAVASISAHNTAIKKVLEQLGEVHVVTDANVLANIEYLAYALIVCGSNNGTAWDTAKLAKIKTATVPVLCCDAESAAYFEIGTDGGDAAAKTTLNALATIDGSEFGIGSHGWTGLDAGANTISSSTTYNTLDMETDGDVVYTQYGYETANDGTDVLLGMVWRLQPDGTIATDEDAAEVAHDYGFYGPAYSAAALNSLGQGVLWIMGHMLLHGKTANVALTISGEIGDLETKLLGNMKTKHTNTVPLAAFISGNIGGTGTEMPNSKALYDIIGASYVNGGGAFQADSVRDDLRTLGKFLIDGTEGNEAGSGLPGGKSLFDIIGSTYTADAGGDHLDTVAAHLNLISKYIADGDGDWATGSPLPGDKSLYDAHSGGIAAVNRVAGKTQVFEKSVTAAANAGATLLATVTAQPCIIEAVIVHSDAAGQVDLTSAAITGGNAGVITFLNAGQTAKALIDAENEQVAWQGAVRLPATATIFMALVGTGVTEVDLTVTFKYRACVSNGYLV